MVLGSAFIHLPASLHAFAITDANLGAKIAAQGTPKGVAPCINCHGPDGAGMAPAACPRIAGLNAEYMANQLRDIATTIEQFHGGKFDYYGTRKTTEGLLLGAQPATK